MCMGILPACMSVHTCMPDGHGGQKVSNLLELELQKVVSFHVCIENGTHGPLEEQPVLLNTKPSLQASFPFVYSFYRQYVSL